MVAKLSCAPEKIPATWSGKIRIRKVIFLFKAELSSRQFFITLGAPLTNFAEPAAKEIIVFSPCQIKSLAVSIVWPALALVAWEIIRPLVLASIIRASPASAIFIGIAEILFWKEIKVSGRPETIWPVLAKASNVPCANFKPVWLCGKNQAPPINKTAKTPKRRYLTELPAKLGATCRILKFSSSALYFKFSLTANSLISSIIPAPFLGFSFNHWIEDSVNFCSIGPPRLVEAGKTCFFASAWWKIKVESIFSAKESAIVLFSASFPSFSEIFSAIPSVATIPPTFFTYSSTHSFLVTQFRPCLTALNLPCRTRKLK